MSFVSLNPNTNAQSTLVIEFNVSVQVLPMTSIKVKFPTLNPMAPSPLQSNILNRLEDCTSNTVT